MADPNQDFIDAVSSLPASASLLHLNGYNPSFDTSLDPIDESLYRVWKNQVAPGDTGKNYDYRGAYAAGIMPSLPSGHWPDTFKKPNHPTFSVESQYSGAYPEKAGSWEDDLFISPNG